MLIRFRPDVITLQADVVVIMAGTNDIAGNTGSIRLTEILGNLISMVELARSHGIEVILCSVLPATSFSWVPELEPAPQIAQLNTMIQNYAQSQGITYLDYYAALVNEKMGLKKRYTRDGVHPNRAGYQVMEKLVQKHLSRYISDHP
jgi:lysophospholipase L1-like esterase